MTKPREFWLVRDSFGGKFYTLSSQKPRPFVSGMWEARDARVSYCFCPEMFHRATGICLNPGEGPVRVRLAMEIVG